MGDPLDDFIEYDLGMGGNEVECPYCGAKVPCSLFFNDVVECPECGKKFKKE